MHLPTKKMYTAISLLFSGDQYEILTQLILFRIINCEELAYIWSALSHASVLYTCLKKQICSI